MQNQKHKSGATAFLLIILSLLFIAPVIIVLINSFKGQFYIADAPFTLPNALTFSGAENYINGIEKTVFFQGKI